MGGLNSGRQRSTNCGTIEQFPAVDLRTLRRAGLIRVGECKYTTLHWQNQALGDVSVRIFIDLSDDYAASMRIVGTCSNGAITQRVTIERVPCPYGAARCYFLCPIVGVRCEQLYLVNGAFASRKAHRLTYASQSEDELSRARRKARKLGGQVEGDARFVRPRGRNRWHMEQQLRMAERKARVLYSGRLRRLIGEVP